MNKEKQDIYYTVPNQDLVKKDSISSKSSKKGKGKVETEENALVDDDSDHDLRQKM